MNGQRVVAMAVKRLPADQYYQDYPFIMHREGYDFALSEFEFLGMVGMDSEIRSDAKEKV